MDTRTSLLPLLADAGLPMIFLTLPAMILLLIPTIIIEGFLCQKWLGLTTWQAMKSNAVSNLVSTILGVPIAWGIMLAIELGMAGVVNHSSTLENLHSPLANAIFFLFSSAWIGPPEGNQAWMIPAAILALLVPFFFASYGTEYLVMKHMVGMREGGNPNLAYPRVRIAVRNANLITYGAMFAASSVWLVILFRHR